MVRKTILGILVCCMVMLCATTVFAQVQLHGFLLARTLVTNNNYTSRIDRYGIKLAETIDEEFDWVTEIYIHPTITAATGRLYMESAYLNWHMQNYVPWDFTVRIGKGRNYAYGITPDYSSRRTTDYSLYSEAFTQQRVVGFQTFSNFNNIQLAVALINPYTNASRTLPDFALGNSLPIAVCDRDTDESKIQRVAISGRLGYKTSIFNVGADLYMSELGSMDDNEQTRYGLDGELKLESGLMAQAQFTMAKTGALDHNGGEALVGYEKDKVGLYGRYGMLAFDDKAQGLNQIMLSAVYKIRPRVHLRLEGLVNGEDEDAAKGWAKCDNDVLLFETLFAW